MRINLGEYIGSSELVKQIVNPRQQLLVLLGDLIQSMIVHTHPLGTIFLWEKITGAHQGDELERM
jgi:hypothetical protein